MKMWEKVAVGLASVGAVNWLTAKLLNFDVLSFVPTGMFYTLVVVAIGASGAYTLYLLFKKQI